MTINYFTLYVFLFMFIIYRKVNRDTSSKLDEEADTASDYTIKVKNYPNPGRGIDIDEDIKEFFESKFDLNVKKVNLVYDLTDFNNINEEKLKYIENKKDMLEYRTEHGEFENEQDFEENEIQIDNCNLILHKKQAEFYNGISEDKDFYRHFTGIAFVSFAT